MKTITDRRYKARAIATQIHEWRKANIEGYNATNWSGETLSDYLFDKNYKHQTEPLWYVELDDENVFRFEVMELPDGWFKEIDELNTI